MLILLACLVEVFVQFIENARSGSTPTRLKLLIKEHRWLFLFRQRVCPFIHSSVYVWPSKFKKKNTIQKFRGLWDFSCKDVLTWGHSPLRWWLRADFPTSPWWCHSMRRRIRGPQRDPHCQTAQTASASRPLGARPTLPLWGSWFHRGSRALLRSCVLVEQTKNVFKKTYTSLKALLLHNFCGFIG